jgi:hypothetical protein
VGISIAFDGAPDCRCHCGQLVVGEVNRRHGPGYKLAEEMFEVPERGGLRAGKAYARFAMATPACQSRS